MGCLDARIARWVGAEPSCRDKACLLLGGEASAGVLPDWDGPHVQTGTDHDPISVSYRVGEFLAIAMPRAMAQLWYRRVRAGPAPPVAEAPGGYG